MTGAIARALVGVLVPDRCLACRAPAAGGLCGRCRQCVLQLPVVRGAAVPDEGVAAALVRRGKDAGARRAGRVMAAVTFERVLDRRCLLPAVAAVTWVPADPRRGGRRGYHLPELYARSLGRALRVDPLPLLTREHAPPQRGSDVAQRHRNVRGRFHAGTRADTLRGRHVLVVDDVMTTGATLEHACAALSRLGLSPVPFAFAAVPRRHASRR